MSLERVLTSRSPEQTLELGAALGALLAPGDFVGLNGGLGAGKTHFVRGVAQGAGVPASQVASPSFAIVYAYQGRLALQHADFYRLANEEELYATGFFDLLGTDAAVLVEWLDRVPRACPPEHLVLQFDPVSDGERRIQARSQGARHDELLRRWRP